MLGLADLGGSFGRSIVSYDTAIGILRVLGLFVLGIILIAPRACSRLDEVLNVDYQTIYFTGNKGQTENTGYQPALQSSDYYNKKFGDNGLSRNPMFCWLKKSRLKRTRSASRPARTAAGQDCPAEGADTPEVDRKNRLPIRW